MKQESTVQKSVGETIDTENPGLSEAKGRVLKHWESARQLFGKSLEEVWLCGEALSEVRELLLPLRMWVKWLDSEGIPTSTAYYWMKFSREVEFSKIWKYDTVDQAMKALNPVPPKPKEPAGKVEPDAETEGEASSGTPEEATGGDGTLQAPDDTKSAQEIQELGDKLREAKDQLRSAENEKAELREKGREAEEKLGVAEEKLGVAEKRIAELLQENMQLKRQLEEKGTPKETTSVDQQQIYPNSAFSGNSEDPGPGGARTTAAPVSRENTGHSDPISPEHPARTGSGK